MATKKKKTVTKKKAAAKKTKKKATASSSADAPPAPFEGFGADGLALLQALASKNEKATFEKHRAGWEEGLLAPARSFVVEVGDALRAAVSPDIQSQPRVGGSIMRMNRDIRFSKDKSPYKPHLDMFFWEGPPEKSWECAGFFFRMFHDRLLLGGGTHDLGDRLARYRKAVDDPKKGKALVDAVAAIEAGGATLGGETYKRIPAGFADTHPRAGLLKHSGLWAGFEIPLPKEVTSRAFVDVVVEKFLVCAPVQRWLSHTM